MGLFTDLTVTNDLKRARKEIIAHLKQKGYKIEEWKEIKIEESIYRVNIFATNFNRSLALELTDKEPGRSHFFKLRKVEANHKAILVIGSKEVEKTENGVTVVPIKVRTSLLF